MADNKIGVGGTIGIVLSVTAALGLGLYFVLKPKTSAAATTTTTGTTTAATNAELSSLKAQLALLQAQQKVATTQTQKDANKAQIDSLLITIGGKLATGAIDSWISGWGKEDNAIVKSDSFDYSTADQGLIDDYVYNYGDI